MIENTVTENEKLLFNKIVFKPFFYENYAKENDTIDERPETSKKPGGDDDEIPNGEEEEEDVVIETTYQ